MKISRFKLMLFFVAFSPFLFVSLNDVFNLLNEVDSQPNKIRVGGAINDASTFAFLWVVISAYVIMLISFVSGRDLRWLPRVVFIMFGFGSVFFFFYGWSVNVDIRKSLMFQGYVECVNKREYALKHTSRTYVLPPNKCD